MLEAKKRRKEKRKTKKSVVGKKGPEPVKKLKWGDEGKLKMSIAL